MNTRQKMWDKLGAPVDLLIIGGGINGAGIARDAVMRGLSVALVEMRDLAYGTSSRSSKLVHGGLRYLEQYEFSLVFEAVSERRILMEIAPHLVHPLGFIFPVYKNSRRNLAVIHAGMWIYEGLSLFRTPKRHRKLKVQDIIEQEPLLNREGLKGAPLYYDCSTDDARLTLENALDAANRGATIATWCKASKFIKDADGRVCGAVIRDEFSGALKEVRASAVVNATGPWIDATLALNHKPDRRLLRTTKGVHIVVERAKLPVNHAVVCFHPDDERVLFAIPWGDRTYLGTTDTDYEGDPAHVIADRHDVDYLLSAAKAYFPDSPLYHEDVIATWAGLRPLIRSHNVDSEESAVSREHQVMVGKDGLITIAGGKLTTYRRMSAEVVDTAIKYLRLANKLPESLTAAHTESEPLPGAQNWPADDNIESLIEQIALISDGHINKSTAVYLIHAYGTRSLELAVLVKKNPDLARTIVDDRPEIIAQIDWAVSQEFAATITDVLIQRTQIFYRNKDQGVCAAPVVAKRMRQLLNWSDDEVLRQIRQYEHDVSLSQYWQKEGDERLDC